MKAIVSFLFQPRIFGACVALFSISALAMALTAEHVFGLKPCILCIYQRYPFAIAFLLGLVTYRIANNENMRGAALMILLTGITFLGNSALAFYHVGVEQLWWESAFEACAFDPSRIRDIAYEPPVPCSSIPWVDPLIGWSMAAWNVVVCGIAGMVCTVFSQKVRAKTYPSSNSLSQ